MKVIKFVISVLLLMSIGEYCFGQVDRARQSKIDSLMVELEKPDITDTTKIQLLFIIGKKTRLFRVSYWDTIVNLTEEALEQKLSTSQNRSLFNLLGGSLRSIGFIYNNQDNLPKALEYYYRCLKIYEELKDDKRIGSCLYTIGNIYKNQDNLSKALEYCYRCVRIYEELKDDKRIESC